MSGPQRLRDLVARWRPVSEAVSGGDLSALIVAWPDIVGDDVARRTRPLSLRTGTLSVLTTSSEWSHHLSFLAPAIIERLDAQAPQLGIKRLRFAVATGRTRALIMRSSATGPRSSTDRRDLPRSRGPLEQATSVGPTPAGENVEELVGHLRREQEALDRVRTAAGWLRCRRCGALFEPLSLEKQCCGLCADELERRADNKVARALQHDPWMRWADVASHVEDASVASYERARRRLLNLWEQHLHHARARLRRGALELGDRMAAWSYMMMRTNKPQRELRRAVIENTIGREWADALLEARPRASGKYQKLTD